MNSKPQCSPKDLFEVPVARGADPIVLEIRGIPVPQNKSRKDKASSKVSPPNYHIPSFKNSKMLVSKDPKGRPLDRPFIMSSPEFQKWMAKATQSLCSQLLCVCQTIDREMQTERSQHASTLWLQQLKKFDDSVGWIPEIHLKVEWVEHGSEGATLTLQRLT